MGLTSPDENGWVPEAEVLPLRALADAVRALLANESAPAGQTRDRDRSRLLDLAFRALEPVDAYNAKAAGWCGAPRVVWAPAEDGLRVETHGDQDGATVTWSFDVPMIIGDEPALYWLSFADDKRPKGEKFLGACMVMAGSAEAAVRESWRLGINPGGEVLISAVCDAARIPGEWRNRLLSRADCAALDAMLEVAG